MQEPEESESSSGIALNDVLIWVLVPALSYLAGALFQAGYNSYFGLPDELANGDPVAIFHASRLYLGLIAYHFSFAIAIPLLFLLYLAILPREFYRAHTAIVLALAAAALVVSFSIRPYVWAIACTLVVVTLRAAPLLPPRLRLGASPSEPTAGGAHPIAVKTLAIVAFLYATFYSAGQQAARFQTEYFITDGKPRYVMLTIDDKGVVAAELLDARCKPAGALPPRLSGYHFARQFKVLSLGDSDAPSFHTYETDGLAPATSCSG